MQYKRMGVHGGYDAQDELHMSTYDNFELNPAYRVVEVNGRKRGIHFLKKMTQYGEVEVYMITQPGNEIETGDYVLDADGTMWICYKMDKYPLVRSTMAICNDHIKWEWSGEVHEYPCVLVDKTSIYSDGLHKTQKVVVADDQIMITLPYNKVTKTLDYGKRIIFRHDKEAIYRIVRIDMLPNWGIVTIRLRHDAYDVFTDNLELGLADYYEKEPDTPENIEDETPGEIENSKDFKIEGYSSIMTGTAETYEINDGGLFEFVIREGTDIAEVSKISNNQCLVRAGKKKGELKLDAILGGIVVDTKKIKVTLW